MTNTPNMQDQDAPLLKLSAIRKEYQSLVANDSIDLTVLPGKIHAILGENGAGKSTLMKIIYGVIQPNAGEIRWHGKPHRIANPAYARSLGIGMVFQHFSLFETLSVVENVALGLDDKPQLAALASHISEVSHHYGLPIDPNRSVHSLSVGEMQRVEIIRCLLQKPKLLIMDEPTSVLSPQAVRTLFTTLRQLAHEGCSILYISHKLDEIRELCHSATVLRAGKITGECIPAQETTKSLARLMIGSDLPVSRQGETTRGKMLLSVNRLELPSEDPFGIDLQQVNLQVHAGEIVGIAGISGNGQKELLQVVSGETPVKEKMRVQLCDTDVGRMGPRTRRRLGLNFVPEERLGRGAVPQLSLTENALMTMRKPNPMSCWLISWKRVRKCASDCVDTFDVRTQGVESHASSLSGGNLQKFIVGREMQQQPQVLVLSQPTWGVDVGAAAFIRQQIINLRNKGVAVLVVSEEIDELFEICDHIAVMANGSLSPTLAISDTDVEQVGQWMSGLWMSEKETA